MSTAAVQEILDRIERLSEIERAALDAVLAERLEVEWRQLASAARSAARERGIDQAAIDRAVSDVRYGR
jgi:hypothetical protein